MGAAAPRQRLWLLCRGTVQGVGFRPMVVRLGNSLQLSGWVRNRIEGVEIELEGSHQALVAFQARLPGAIPSAARLESLERRWLDPRPGGDPADGVIIRSQEGPQPRQPLGAGWLARGLRADRAPCDRCWQEFNDPGNRRFRDPFIGCCDCGPRYAISRALPFLRAHTSLEALPICERCQREWADPDNRRFHCETISCPACGPKLGWIGPGAGDPIELALAVLRNGGILALQGIAGFQWLVDAANPAAIARLREHKQRPEQPLALLAGSLQALEPAVSLSDAERRLLRHPATPIVLLRRHRHRPDLWPGVADRAPALGVMLPASGLHRLLVDGHHGPLVATSANRHGEPMWTTSREARAGLGLLVDGVLVHGRAIQRPLDDSVAEVVEGRPRLVRRSRGYVPEPLRLAGSPPWSASEPPLLAIGADLKCAPALLLDGQCFMAAPIGSLDHSGHLERLEAALGQVLANHPEVKERIVCDAHPGYRSAAVAQRLAPRVHRVIHHQAHALAVVAEHGLSAPLLLLSADGTGFDPSDRSPMVRGCELFLAPAGSEPLQRLGHLQPFPLPGGELAAREPRRTALGMLWATDPSLLEHPGARSLRRAFDPAELTLLRAALAGGCNSPLCSSLGRLFDGVASLLGLVQTLSFEGQGGLWLEGAAANIQTLPTEPPACGEAMAVVRSGDGLWLLDWRPWLRGWLERRAAGEGVEALAAEFQRSLAEGLAQLVVRAAGSLPPADPAADPHLPASIETIALAGGCFQNVTLLQQSATLLRRSGLQPRWSEQVPGHDGGLALGQLAAWRRQFCSDQRPAGQP